jgi:hypothetical protein
MCVKQIEQKQWLHQQEPAQIFFFFFFYLGRLDAAMAYYCPPLFVISP